ncbi:MAG: hypothetical protein FWE27_05500 [Defluviitaleaceae bacterium]|nr:hypothetical protein [Defluviitaleaceae bacterium]
MKKIIPTIKSILIISLAILAIYQVGRLWLVNLTNRNFVLYLQARFPPSAPDGQSAFAQPFRIISGNGNGIFDIRYSEIANSEEWVFGEEIINEILRSGEFQSDSAATFETILAEPVLIYEYAFNMCAETFARALGRRNGAVLTEAGIESFTRIAVQRSSERRVFFINDSQIWEYSLSSFPPRLALLEASIQPASESPMHFIATENGFVPRVDGDGFFYTAVSVENPFSDAQGLFTFSHIRSRVEPFFDNPASIFPSVSVDNVYTFSNRNTTVQYLENAALEYTSYRTIGRAAQENFMADFSAALAFLNDDPFVINEIYLRNHDTRGRAHVFRFNYVIDNHPLILTEPWHTRIYPRCTDPLFAPIEITVDQGRVVRYRRLVYTFHSDGIMWKDAAALERNEHFTLGFPIDIGPAIELQVLLES